MNQEETVKNIIDSFMYETFEECVELIRKAGVTEYDYTTADIAELYTAYQEERSHEENRVMEEVC